MKKRFVVLVIICLLIPMQVSFAQAEESGIPGMVLVEGGTFNNGIADMTISSFYISATELTQAEYELVMGKNPSRFRGAQYPVDSVSWYDVISYCIARSKKEGLEPAYTWVDETIFLNINADGYRLPTEAEWEFAARGGILAQDSTVVGNENADEIAWYLDNSGGSSHPVAQKKANPLGLYDMSGNVWEWCWDVYGAYPERARQDYQGLSEGTSRVRRGGSWNSSIQDCIASTRSQLDQSVYNVITNGFRVVRSKR